MVVIPVEMHKIYYKEGSGASFQRLQAVTLKNHVHGYYISMQLDYHKNYYVIRVQLQYENMMN